LWLRSAPKVFRRFNWHQVGYLQGHPQCGLRKALDRFSSVIDEERLDEIIDTPQKREVSRNDSKELVYSTS
jgi:hypothetical protein